MSWAATRITLRLRLASTVSAAVGLIAVMLMVGALFPAVGHTIGKLNIPTSVANLLGGADYGTITGWFRSEIAVIYAPLVIGALAITGAVGRDRRRGGGSDPRAGARPPDPALAPASWPRPRRSL